MKQFILTIIDHHVHDMEINENGHVVWYDETRGTRCWSELHNLHKYVTVEWTDVRKITKR